MELGYRFLLLMCVVSSMMELGHSRKTRGRPCFKCVIDYRRISTVFDAKFRKVSQDLQEDYGRKLNKTKNELTDSFIGFGVHHEALPESEIGLLVENEMDAPDEDEILLDTKKEVSDLSGMVIDLQLEYDEFKDDVIEFKEEKQREISFLEIHNSEMKTSISALRSSHELLNRTMHTLLQTALSEITALAGKNSEKIALLQAEGEEAKRKAQEQIELQRNEMDLLKGVISTLQEENTEMSESLAILAASSVQEEIATLKEALSALENSKETESSGKFQPPAQNNDEGEEFLALRRQVEEMNETFTLMKAENAEMKETLRTMGGSSVINVVESSPEPITHDNGSIDAVENVTGLQETTSAPTTEVDVYGILEKKVARMTDDIEELQEQMDYMGKGVDVAVKIRLAGGNAKAGRVEVYYHGSWGTICDDYWDRNDGNVVCRMLGFRYATSALAGAAYGEGLGHIWLDDLECDGDEDTLWDCSGRAWGSQNCGHSEDASVVCF